MLRLVYWRVMMVGLLGLMPILTLAQSGAVTYICTGSIKSENIFEAGSVKNIVRHHKVTVNAEAGYVKRDQELAAGCMAEQIEICSCNFSTEISLISAAF